MNRSTRLRGLCASASIVSLAACGGVPKPSPAVPPAAPSPSEAEVSSAPPPAASGEDPWAHADLIQPPAPPKGEAVDLGQVTRQKLPNGLEVIVVPRHTLPVVVYSLVVKSGGLDEPSGKEGVADFTAEMLSKGTRSRTADEIHTAVESVGADLFAGSDTDSTEVGCQSLTKDAATCLSTLADIALHPTFPASEMDEVRQQEVAQVKGRRDDPTSLAEEFFANDLFGDGDPRGVPPSEDSLGSITPKDLAQFHDRTFVPSNAILAIAGDVDPQAAIRQATQMFGGWKGAPVAPQAVEDPAAPSGLHYQVIDKPSLTQTGIVIGGPGVAHSDPDYYALKVVNYILGGGAFSSRLMKEVRSKQGDTYGVRSRFDADRHPGAFVITTKTRTEKTMETLDSILAQVEKLREGGPTQAEVDAAEANLAGSYPIALQTPEQVISSLVDAEIDGLPEDYVQQYAVRVSGVTLDQARAAAAKHLDPKDLYVVMTADAKKLAPLLKDAKLAFETVGYTDPVSRAARQLAKAAITPADAAAGRKVLVAAIAAAGGPKALAAIKDVAMSGKLKITVGPSSQDGTAATYLTTDGAVREEMALGALGKIVMVVGPNGAYQSQGGQRQVFTGEELEAERAKARFSPLGVLVHGLDAGVVLRIRPQKEGQDVVEIDPASGAPILFYFDARTHLLSKIETKEEDHTVVSTFADYRPEGGVQIAHSETISFGPAQIALTFDSIKVNGGLASDLFAVPK